MKIHLPSSVRTTGLGIILSFLFVSPALAAPYASPAGKDFLPNGALVRATDNGEVYYIKNGTKSMVLKDIVDRWFKEAHYFKSDVLIKLSRADLDKYKSTGSVNPLYIGKILKAPDGKQYFIDNMLRRRPISSAVRAALHYPSRNLYPTTDSHIKQFALGPAVTRTDVHPGGTVMYNGPYHGGTVWRIDEDAKGKLTRRLYLQDYIYETQGYPWSSQILPVDNAELARYPRGANIDKYPDGWIVKFDNNTYLVQNETLRYIPDAIIKAMGYNRSYILTVFPEFLRRYPRGEAVTTYKTLTVKVSPTLSAPAAAPNAASNYTKVRPAIRTLIAQVNEIYLLIFQKEATASENAFWVDYLYKGEVNTRTALEAAMRKTATTGVKPAFTSRTAVLSEDVLKAKWFPYMFYFVHYIEPSDADRTYWFDRIDKGNPNTIETLGGALQYIKETYGTTRR